MSEYKLLKEFGEIIPGMIFENYFHELTVLSVGFNKFVGRFIDYKLSNGGNGCQSVGSFDRKYKLTHDPRKKEDMSEYKLLKEFDEIVPGMIFEIFESKDHNRINIVSKTYRNCMKELSINYTLNDDSQIRSDNIMHMGDKFKLIYDPRPKSIQEKINDHKKQIEILEKELQKESLKNVFVKDQYYKIKTKDDTFICKFGMSDYDKSFIWVECVDRITRKISTDNIQKVWHVENLKDVFGFCNSIFERKD